MLDTFLEIPDGLTHAVCELGQLLGPKQQEDNGEENDELWNTDAHGQLPWLRLRWSL
jgi:hypothetical protein